MAKTTKTPQDDQDEVVTQAVIKRVELTQEGLDELTSELQELTTVKLPTVIARVSKARDFGDLAENSEYHSARDEQQLIEARIDEIQGILSNAKVIKLTKSHDKVGVGSVLVIKEAGKKSSMTVHVVGEFESTPGENKISSVSPMGKALMHKKKGDTVIVKAPAGEIEFTIEEIK